MNNLIKLANAVHVLMQQSDDIGAERNRVQALDTRAKMIHRIREKCDITKESRSNLIEAGVPVKPTPKASRQLINRSKKIQADFEKDWEKTVKDPSIKTNFIDPADEHVDNKILRSLREDWRSYVDSQTPDIKLDWLKRLPDSVFGEAKRDIFELLGEISELGRSLPEDRSTVARIIVAAKKAGERFATVDQIPEPVRLFLAKATRGDALIVDLSDDVSEWLAKNDMLDELRIRFG
jgi:hypothetical protein